MAAPFPKKAHEFHLKEFELLRKEVEYRTASQERVERGVFIGVIAIFAALKALNFYDLPISLRPVANWLWFLPAIVVVLGGARFLDDHAGIHAIGQYLKKLESHSIQRVVAGK